MTGSGGGGGGGARRAGNQSSASSSTSSRQASPLMSEVRGQRRASRLLTTKNEGRASRFQRLAGLGLSETRGWSGTPIGDGRLGLLGGGSVARWWTRHQRSAVVDCVVRLISSRYFVRYYCSGTGRMEASQPASNLTAARAVGDSAKSTMEARRADGTGLQAGRYLGHSVQQEQYLYDTRREQRHGS